jgi:hypothetical protein
LFAARADFPLESANDDDGGFVARGEDQRLTRPGGAGVHRRFGARGDANDPVQQGEDFWRR